ncbi:polymer-forming cytoskeletal protein [Flavobacterium sp.]|uniref:bactofilin family protein n=1 Tax=Flavobacterium sp. TaxID=239 RepID=UPI00263804AC|nr:polymer-forming cytoskeletal protein [Flavobacterium sp.]
MFGLQSKSAPNTAIAPVQPIPPKRKISFKTMIDSTFSSEGRIVLTGNLRIDGSHQGNILKADDMQGEVVVYIGPSGVVTGEVSADLIIIDGTLEGVAMANSDLHIRSGGKLIGQGFYMQACKVDGEVEAELKKAPASPNKYTGHAHDLPPNVTSFDKKRES